MTESFDTSPMPDPNPPVMPDPDIGAPTDPFNPNAPHTTPLPEPGLPGEEGSLLQNTTPVPDRLTPQSLRNTFISLPLAIGEDVSYVMARSATRTGRHSQSTPG